MDSHLVLYLQGVGYDSNEVDEILSWAEELLEGMDAWMKEENE